LVEERVKQEIARIEAEREAAQIKLSWKPLKSEPRLKLEYWPNSA